MSVDDVQTHEVSSFQKYQAASFLRNMSYGKEEMLVYNLFLAGEFKTRMNHKIRMLEESGHMFYHLVSLLGEADVFDSEVKWRTISYEPIYSKKVFHLTAGKIEASVVYSEQQADVHLLLPQEEKFVLHFNEPVYDNEQIINILRAMDFQHRGEVSFRYIYPFAKHIQTALARVITTENVRVKAGEFVSFQVQLIIPGQRILLWYNQNHPHQMVRYQSENQHLVLELRDYNRIDVSERE